MTTPSLRSRRLILYPYTPVLVADEHVRWLNDPELMQFSEQRHYRHTLRSQISYAGRDSPDRHLWLIRCGTTDIGTISAYVDDNNKNANLGILIGKKEYQGQGFAAEAWCTVIDWLFSEGYHKVECGCREDNEPMKRLAMTTGFELEAQISQHFKVGDEFRDLVLFGRFAADKFESEWETMLNVGSSA